MRKNVLAAVLLTAAVCLSGCGKEEKPVPTELVIVPLTEAPTAAAPQNPETEAPSEEVQTTDALQETEALTEAVTEPNETTAPEETASVSGKITGAASVNVRQGPSIHTKVVTKLKKGQEVRATEKVVLDSVGWAHIEEGWVCVDYLKLDGPIPESKSEGTMGVIFHTDKLNVREEPSTDGKIVGKIYRNDVVTVYETRKVGPGLWGRIDMGWISMDYVQMQDQTGSVELSVTGGDYDPMDALPGNNDFVAPSEGVYPGNGPILHPDDLNPVQRPCQHPHWKLWKHLDEQWTVLETYTCTCGQDEANIEGWKYHAAISKDDGRDHSGYSLETKKVLIHAETDFWECEDCGVVKPTYNGAKP